MTVPGMSGDKSAGVAASGSGPGRRSVAVAAGPQARRSAFLAAGVLVLGGVFIGIGALVGVAHTYDGSARGQASGAVWVVLLPALVALLCAVRRPELGLAVSAGAGTLGGARLLADLSLLSAPNAVVRPELFYEVSVRAQPFGVAPGAFLVLLGDLLLLAGGIIAAGRMARVVSYRATERGFDAPISAQRSELGPDLLAEALESSGTERPAQTDEPDDRPIRSNRLLVAGFAGVMVLLTASLSLPYRGGYFDSRYLSAELDLSGVTAALVLALLATVGLLVAAALPRLLAIGLLAGVAIAGAIPFLTAVAVRATRAPVELGVGVAVGIAGCVLLGAAGLLTRSGLIVEAADDSGLIVKAADDEPSAASSRLLDGIGAALSLGTGASCVLAWRWQQLSYNGGPDPVLRSGFAISAPLSTPYLVAAFLPLIGGVLWFVPPLARAGRVVAGLGWIPLLFAVTQSLSLLGTVQASAQVPNLGFAAPTWSSGSGLWCGIAGTALGVAVLGIALKAGRRAADASVLVVDDESAAGSGRNGTVVAALLTILTLVALAVPTYRTAAESAPTLRIGFALDSWGVWALAAGMIAAAWFAARTTWAAAASAFALTGGAIGVVRLVIPAAVRAQPGFGGRPGLVLGFAAVAAFVLAAGMFAAAARGVRLLEPSAAIPAGRPARAGTPTGASTGGASSRGASSTRTKGRPR